MIDGAFGFDACPLNATPFAHAAVQPIRFTEPAEVAAAYRFPADSQGKGQSIAIIELGGGFHDGDLSAFFANQRLKKPKVTVIGINGMKNNPASAGAIQKAWKQSGMQSLGRRLPHALPGRHPDARKESPDASEDPDSPLNVLWTIESTVDIEVAGALANEADIRVYYAPNTLQGKFDAFVSALFDQKSRPAAFSCSWGTHEDTLPAAYIKLIDRVFQCAALLGVTVCHSAGDDGDGSPQGGEPRVHFPASSPHVLAVGGTQLLLAGGARQETYWDEMVGAVRCLGGHGVSKQFRVPAWQAGADVKRKTKREGRGIPDVAGKADLHTGYDCVIGQIKIPGGGTSAAAPMWAALIARLNAKLRAPVGYLTPLLYQKQLLGATNPVGGAATKEQNGASRWEALTGMGSPNGEGLLAALTPKRR
jgi:kumamolisin